MFPPSSKARAFTIAELLTVIAIFAIVTAFAVGAFTHIGRSGSLGKAGHDLVGILEGARAHAVSHGTYTWVGLEQAADDELVVGVVASREGAAAPAAAGLAQLGPVRRYRNTRLVALPDDAAHRQNGDGVVALVSLTNGAIYPFAAGPHGAQTTFGAYVIEFNRRGESRVASGRLYKTVEIALQESVQGMIRNPNDYVAIQLGGLSGVATLHRP